MKNLKLTLVIIAGATMFVACKDEKKELAQKKADSYVAYIDSVRNVDSEKAIQNWEAIETNYLTLKTDLNNSTATIEEDSALKNFIDEATLNYENHRAEIMADQKRLLAEKYKATIRTSLLGGNYSSNDMQFTWINKDNILSVYQNFVDTVFKNKDTYSREDWDEIKLLYEAIDTRKNTVENEGLLSADNRKIALLN